MAELEVTCPFCGRLNELTTEGFKGWERVNCSHCHQELGRKR
jgi:phage FluMu protein Com